MSDLTRRGFVKNSAAATAGMTVIGALLADQAGAAPGRPGLPGRSSPTSAIPARARSRSCPATAKCTSAIASSLLRSRAPRAEPPHRSAQHSFSQHQSEVEHVVSSRGAGDQQGPGRRQHRHIRVRQPGRPEHGHDHLQLPAARGAVRRTELLRVRRRRPVRDPHRQRRRRQPDITYEFEFKTEVRNPDTFLYNTGPIAVDRQRELEPAAVLHGHARRDQWPPRSVLGTRGSPARRATSARRSTPNYEALASAGGPRARRRPHRVRRPAARGVLRRPRGDLRPRRPAAVPEPAPGRDGPAGRRGRRHATASASTRSRSRSRCRADQGRVDADQPDVPRRR